MTRRVRLAGVVQGKSRLPDPDSVRVVQFANGEELEVLGLTSEVAADILSQDRYALRDLPLHDIIAFVTLVGKNWKSHEYPRRRLYIRYLSVLGLLRGDGEARSELDCPLSVIALSAL